MSGYIPQYDYSARMIYEALADGSLEWLGVADRSAGKFDDLVLGLRERIKCFQVKTSREPRRFNIRTLLLGSGALLASFATTWSKVSADAPNLPLEVHYVCDDDAADGDSLNASGGGVSSAAFLRAVAENRHWSLNEWMASPFAEFVRELKAESGLEEAAFVALLSGIHFVTGSKARPAPGFGLSHQQFRRIGEIAALLPRLLAEAPDKDRWSRTELLQRLNWHDTFAARHGHVFPYDALVQSNPETQAKLEEAIAAAASGYIALVGAPGCGKSTLLQTGVLPTPRCAVLRYLAFMPAEGHHLSRGEAFDFLHDLIVHLKKLNFGAKMMVGATLDELHQQFPILLQEAGAHYKRTGVRTIIVVDGLDHVPREEKPERSLLKELPLPTAVPEGVLFILGTQRLSLDDLRPAVRDQASEPARCVRVAPLPKEALHRIADLRGLAADCDRDIIYERSQGHPLAMRYLVEGLLQLQASDRDAQRRWLQDGPSYGGDVEVFYQRAWRELEHDQQAREVLTFVALAEGQIRQSALDDLLDSVAVDRAWHAAGHLLREASSRAWSVFHNSFRLFLIERTNVRRGRPDPEQNQVRYRQLAEMARKAAPDDEQRWMELRYRARAGDHADVLLLCTPARIRGQFIDGRNPHAIHDDIKLGFIAAAAQGSRTHALQLFLARHEIEMRCEAMGVDELVDAYVATGELDKAVSLADMDGAALTTGKSLDVVDALLRKGRPEEACRLFESHEPLEKLLGSEPIDGHSRDDELILWARRAPVFRSTHEIVTSIDRLHERERAFPDEFSLAEFQQRLRFEAARASIERNPTLIPNEIAESYGLSEDWAEVLTFISARAQFDSGEVPAAIAMLEGLRESSDALGDSGKRQAAWMAFNAGDVELARELFLDVEPPQIEKEDAYRGDLFEHSVKDVFRHARLHGALGLNGDSPQSLADNLLAQLQHRIESLGRLYGAARGGRTVHQDQVLRDIKSLLTFLNLAESDKPGHDFNRSLLTKSLMSDRPESYDDSPGRLRPCDQGTCAHPATGVTGKRISACSSFKELSCGGCAGGGSLQSCSSPPSQ